MKKALDILKEHGYKPISDLNYCTDNGVEYYIGINGTAACVVAIMHDEENLYLITKPELREMSWTARIKGIFTVTLLTNYGIELHSKYENANTVGFDDIEKLINPISIN